MKLADLEIFVVGNPPPGWGGRYFVFVKVTTACGVVGMGEVYAAAVGPVAMQAVIRDVFERHMEGESPANIELMFRARLFFGVYHSGPIRRSWERSRGSRWRVGTFAERRSTSRFMLCSAAG